MTIYQYSGTVTGFFCVIFEIYTKKQPPALITSEREYQYLLDTSIQIVDDHLQHAERVERSIQQKIGKAGFQEILTGLSSGCADKEMILYEYIRLVFQHQSKVRLMQQDKHVIAFRLLVHQVSLEIHRMEGFLRFKQLANGVFYAQYEPDHDITQYLLAYFKNRNNTISFIIHDQKRNIFGMYNTKQSCLIQSQTDFTPVCTDEETAFLTLWHQYFHTVQIADRANKKLQRNYMPQRYQKNMPETYPDINKPTVK